MSPWYRAIDLRRGEWHIADRGAVVLVQPERDDRDMYAEYLAHMGLTPICVQDADAALRLACRADIIVTELLLPGALDGYELIQRLKNSAPTGNIPIVVLTVCVWTAEQARARSAGGDAFLSKPCLPHALLRELCRMLRSTHQSTTGTKLLDGRVTISTRHHAEAIGDTNERGIATDDA